MRTRFRQIRFSDRKFESAVIRRIAVTFPVLPAGALLFAMRAVPLPLFVDEVVVDRLPDKLANLVVAQGNGWYGRPNGRRFAHCGFIRFLSRDKRGRKRHPSPFKRLWFARCRPIAVCALI
jgi:hypothetical protein